MIFSVLTQIPFINMKRTINQRNYGDKTVDKIFFTYLVVKKRH